MIAGSELFLEGSTMFRNVLFSLRLLKAFLLSAYILLPLSALAQGWTKIGVFDGAISLVKFVDENNGFVGLGMSPGRPNYPQPPIELYRTSDAGKTWRKCVTPPGYSGEIADVLMTDSLHGWLAMTCYGGSGTSALWHTTDGGWSWNETPLQGSGTSVRISPHAMIVTDLFNQGHISTDGGQSFHDGFLASTNCCDFVDDLHGVISDYRGQNWLTSNDGGITWNNSTMNVEAWTVYGVMGTSDFYSAPEGWTNGTPYNNGIIYKSTDYGSTFSQIASFPFRFDGHLAGIGDKLLVFQVQDFDSDKDLVNHGGFYYSTDQGTIWTGIKGPSGLNDVRFCLVNGCSGLILYGFDDKPACSLWRYDFTSGTGAFSPVEQAAMMHQDGCQQVDTFVHFKTCGQVTLDSVWLEGSSSFAITQGISTPYALDTLDSIGISYLGTQGPDTAELHLRYAAGAGTLDTTILLIGTLPSPLLAQPQRLHRESASAFFGSADTLPLAVDISSTINLDSLWPYLSAITATYSWDSSIASFITYLPPTGWILNSLANHGNAVNISIQNGSASASQPLDLGTALFRPKTTRIATSWVRLPTLILQVGDQQLSLCTTDNEDSHWAIKTLGVQSGVSPLLINAGTLNINWIRVSGDQLRIGYTVSGIEYADVQFQLFDLLGREVCNTSAQALQSSVVLNVQGDASGVYFLRLSAGNRTTTQKIVLGLQ